jgi:hypothetical protein
MTISKPSCAFEGCCQLASYELRFELAEPADPKLIVGTFMLPICHEHYRPEFTAAAALVDWKR